MLRASRTLVEKVFQRAEDLCRCPHREMRWSKNVLRLDHGTRRSGYPCQPDLEHPMWSFLLNTTASSALVGWLEQAKSASEVRLAAILESYDHARFSSIQNLRFQLAKSGGTLDTNTLRAALGKRQPYQRMWGVSSPAVLGVAFAPCESPPGGPSLAQNDTCSLPHRTRAKV